jgi:hypothetical protein
MRPEHRIHGISHAMAALVDVVHAGRLSYADAEEIVASLAKLYDATMTPRAELEQPVWPDEAPPRDQYNPPEAQRVAIHYTRWLVQRTQRTRAQQERYDAGLDRRRRHS